MNHTDPMGRLMLKTSGILMIVFGVFGVLVYLAVLGVLVGVTYVTDGIFSGTKDIIGMSLLLAASAVELIAGIRGVKAVKSPDRVSGCRIRGILALILGLAAMLHILLRGQDPIFWLGIPLTVVTPAAYLIGASRLAAYRPEEEEELTDNSEA